jgi:drug/metabolite transporter (DMT)-like permease
MKSPLRAHLTLLAMVVIWGLNFPIAKIALAHVPPLAFNALRFPMASLLLFIVLKARGTLRLPTGRDLPRAVIIGLLGNMLYQQFFIFGLDHTSAGNASLLLAGTPIVTALLSASMGHERVRLSTWIGVFCTFIGIALIVFGKNHGAEKQGTLTGDLLMLGATIMWAFYTVASRPLVERNGPVLVTAWTLWAGTVGLVLIGLPSVLRLDFGAIQMTTWAAIVYAGVLSIGLAYIFWYYGVSKLGNARTSSYSNVTPVVALVGAWLSLGEVPRLVQIIGAAVIITGVTIAQSSGISRALDVSVEV